MTQMLPVLLSADYGAWGWTDFKNYPGQIKSSICIVIILSIILIIQSRKIKKIDPLGKTPMWLVPLIAAVKVLNNTTKTNMGRKWKVFAPMFMTIALFLLVANTSAIWGISNPTNYIMVNAALVTYVFIIIQTTGIVSMGPGKYLKSFTAPIFIMTPINLLGEFTLPLSMALRLFGNILSGTVISGLIVGLLGWSSIIVMPALNAVFDIFFGAIQVLVFLILTMIYAGMKVKDEDKIYS